MTRQKIEDRKRQLASAADALLADYAAEGELTAFSVLDGEHFHAWRRSVTAERR
jgi:hypothetical protein